MATDDVLHFRNHRLLGPGRPPRPGERSQSEARGILADSRTAEVVDVTDSSGVAYTAWFYEGGSAVFFRGRTTEVVASACQHSLDRCDDKDLWKRFGDAYRRSEPPIRQMIDFSIPEPVLRHPRLGSLVFDDAEDQWRAEVVVNDRSVAFWFSGGVTPVPDCIADAIAILDDFDGFVRGVEEAAGLEVDQVSEVALWEQGRAQVFFVAAGQTDVRRLIIELP
ncbi:MAG: hypothetical protein KC619_23185 [Myxococcales bacterium]|nr:hypothetical protein [Myxococcales bacterium]